MKGSLMKLLISLVCTGVLSFCNLAFSEHFTVSSANDYPYRNLIDRTDDVKVFYTETSKGFNCRVEVKLDNMKWVSVEKKMNKELFSDSPLSNCLSREVAEQMLLQSFLQFGRGL